jgi:hypothetical protein
VKTQPQIRARLADLQGQRDAATFAGIESTSGPMTAFVGDATLIARIEELEWVLRAKSDEREPGEL